MGAYHTVDVEPNRKFALTKTYWDIVALERIDTACDPSQNADVAAIVMQEGIAHVCLLTGAMTLVRAKIDMAIPRKRRGGVSQYEKVSLSRGCALFSYLQLSPLFCREFNVSLKA
jgi:protein pelota